ncbi:S-adenosyl-L-methionine-dependent methyltransferase [Baffinella frigidus]|nr:S-adenosyl-L-methionine-dependent methyltransferase [Cryptophyta sp. CCMP2293]
MLRNLSRSASRAIRRGPNAAVLSASKGRTIQTTVAPNQGATFGATRKVDVDSNDYYNGLSQHYHMFQRDWDAMMTKEGKNFQKYFEGHDVKKVLDASCGTGEQSIALGKVGYDVVATDPSAGLVDQCSQNAKKFDVEKNVRSQQSDFLNLNKDFAPNSFDAIVTKGSSLPHLHTDADLLQACQNFHTLLRPGGVVNIGVRDYDYFIRQSQQIYARQVRMEAGKPEHLMFDVWEWHKGKEGQQLVNFNTFHVNGEEIPGEYKTSKFVTTFRALFQSELVGILEKAGFTDIKVSKIDGWLWENVYSATKPK